MEKAFRRGQKSGSKSKAPLQLAEDLKAQQLKKIKKNISKIESDLEKKSPRLWVDLGEWLKAHPGESPSLEDFPKYDPQKDYAWNLNHSFQKSKDLRAKAERSQERIKKLQADFESLNQVSPEDLLEALRSKNPLPDYLSGLRFVGPLESLRPRKKASQKKVKSLLELAGIKGRTYQLPEGHQFFVGKQAADNLKLLRAARAWYLWFHLKDHPGAHGILRRNKGESIPDSKIHLAAQWLLTHQWGEKSSKYQGDKFSILVAECRYVRPIKGDRVGRVHYTNAQTLNLRFQPQKG